MPYNYLCSSNNSFKESKNDVFFHREQTQTSFVRIFSYFNANARQSQTWSYLSDVSYPQGSRRGYDYNNTSLAYGNERFIKMKTSRAKTWFMSVLFMHHIRVFLFTHQFNLKTLLCLQTYIFILSTSYGWVSQCGMWRYRK